MRRFGGSPAFGDLVTFNPHTHVLAAHGVFRADGVLVVLPAIPVKLLEQGFRSKVLKLLLAEGRKKLAHYMLRAPFSLEKLTYLPGTGMVMYRSHMYKGLKRNFQLMPGAQWLDILCRHIPDLFEHLVWYVAWDSTCCRGERAHAAAPVPVIGATVDSQAVEARAKSAWARLSL